MFKKVLYILLFVATSLYANLLQNGLVIIDNTNVVIPNEAEFVNYLNQIGDNNLTAQYKNATRPIDNLTDKFQESTNKIQTYEEAFDALDVLYSMIVDKNSSEFLLTKQEYLKLQIKSITSQLLEAKRSNYTDPTIINLIIKYYEVERELIKIKIFEKQAYGAARDCALKLLNKQYTFKRPINDIQKDLEYYKKQLNTATDKELIAAYKNAILIDEYNLLFAKNVQILQSYHENKSWRNALKPDFGIYDKNISTASINPNDSNFAVYDGNYTKLLKVIEESKTNNKVAASIILIFHDTFFGVEWNHFILQAEDWWLRTKDYSIFVFDNNSIQVQDVLSIAQIIVLIFIISKLTSFIIDRYYNNGFGQLFKFVVEILAILYILFYISTNILGFNSSNLAMFASAFSIVIGFGLQSVIQNFVAGLMMIGDKTIKVGDSISLSNGQNGEVVNISYRTTTIKTEDNTLIMLPNYKMIQESIENKSKHDPRVRVQIDFFVRYGTNIDTLEKQLILTCKTLDGYDSEMEPTLGIKDSNADGIIISLMFFVIDAKYANKEIITRILYAEVQNSVKMA